jgi:leucyl/phenylalanyl-tRNA--protein transferase
VTVTELTVTPSRITSDPIDILTHYALGELPSYSNGVGSPTLWYSPRHRGVHLLQRIVFPRSQRRYVLSDKFELRFDTAFREVLEGCADVARVGHTWIVPELREGYLKLFEMGFAHSFEAWRDGQLAGGCFGVQLGSYISVESMFYRVSHASKAAYGRTLLHLKERGFTLVDSNPVDDPSRNYGEEWIPSWRYEELLRQAIERKATLCDGAACPELPGAVRRKLPIVRLVRKVARRVLGDRGDGSGGGGK